MELLSAGVLVAFIVVVVVITLYLFGFDNRRRLETGAIMGGTRATTPRQTLRLSNDRKYSKRELAAVDAARTYNASHPEASAIDIVNAVYPEQPAGRKHPAIWWADVVAPAFVDHFGLDVTEFHPSDPSEGTDWPFEDALEFSDDRLTDGPHRHGIITDTDADDTPSHTTRNADERTDRDTTGDAGARRTDHDDERGVDPLAVPGPFELQAVSESRNALEVGDETNSAWFEPVERDGDVSFKPTDADYRTGEVDVEWYVDAADALETAVRNRESPTTVDRNWLDVDGWNETMTATPVRTPDGDRYRCQDVTNAVRSNTDASVTRAVESTSSPRYVAVTGGGESSTLVVDRGSVQFPVVGPSTVDFPLVGERSDHRERWATRAVTAVDASCHWQPEPTDDDEDDARKHSTGDTDDAQTDTQQTDDPQTDTQQTDDPQADTQQPDADGEPVPEPDTDPE